MEIDTYYNIYQRDPNQYSKWQDKGTDIGFWSNWTDGFNLPYIFKDPDEGDAFLLDGEEIFALAFGFGGYGFTSAVPFDSFGLNEVPDLLFTYSWGSGMHRSHLAIFSRTTRETQDLYVYYSYGVQGGSDLLVEWVTDERGASSYTVYTADVTVNGEDYTDLSFTKRAKAGVVAMVLPPAGGSGGGKAHL